MPEVFAIQRQQTSSLVGLRAGAHRLRRLSNTFDVVAARWWCCVVELTWGGVARTVVSVAVCTSVRLFFLPAKSDSGCFCSWASPGAWHLVATRDGDVRSRLTPKKEQLHDARHGEVVQR